jgi:hypothetical protein
VAETADKSIAQGISLREACELAAILLLLESPNLAMPQLLFWLKKGLLRWTYMHVAGLPRQKYTLEEEAGLIWQAALFDLVVSLNASQVARPTLINTKGKVLHEVTVSGIRIMREDIIAAAKEMVTVPAGAPVPISAAPRTGTLPAPEAANTADAAAASVSTPVPAADAADASATNTEIVSRAVEPILRGGTKRWVYGTLTANPALMNELDLITVLEERCPYRVVRKTLANCVSEFRRDLKRLKR